MQRPAPLSKPISHKILPVVTRVIEQVDKLFIELSGVTDRAFLDSVFQQWLISGKTSPSGLRHYIGSLRGQLEGDEVREEFSSRAELILLHLQSGYVS